MAQLLRLIGHDVHEVYDGRAAVQSAASLRPEVVILDIGMPDIDGYEIARRIRQESWGKEMLLLALTGWGQEDDRRRAFDAGFDHHLTKPVTAAAIDKLLTEIERDR